MKNLTKREVKKEKKLSRRRRLPAARQRRRHVTEKRTNIRRKLYLAWNEYHLPVNVVTAAVLHNLVS